MRVLSIILAIILAIVGLIVIFALAAFWGIIFIIAGIIFLIYFIRAMIGG